MSLSLQQILTFLPVGLHGDKFQDRASPGQHSPPEPQVLTVPSDLVREGMLPDPSVMQSCTLLSHSDAPIRFSTSLTFPAWGCEHDLGDSGRVSTMNSTEGTVASHLSSFRAVGFQHPLLSQPRRAPLRCFLHPGELSSSACDQWQLGWRSRSRGPRLHGQEPIWSSPTVFVLQTCPMPPHPRWSGSPSAWPLVLAAPPSMPPAPGRERLHPSGRMRPPRCCLPGGPWAPSGSSPFLAVFHCKYWGLCSYLSTRCFK